MAYIGATPANTFQSLTSQTLTGDGGTSYTLNTSVSTAADIAVFVNNVRQNPNSSYTASGTSLSMSAAVSSSDGFYVVYLGKAVGTINPASGSVGTSQIVDGNVTGAKFNADVISAQTELSSQPADTDEFIVSDAGVLKRIDYSLIKGTTVDVNKVAKGWINFDGTGSVNIRDSEGFSSVTDNNTGDYSVTFSTAFANTNYCAVTGQSRNNNGAFNDNTGIQIAELSTTNIRVYTWRPYDRATADHEVACITVFGDQ